MRVFTYARNAVSSKSERSRIASLVSREPHTALVYRSSGGLTGPRTFTLVGEFIGRLEAYRQAYQQDYNTDAIATQTTPWIFVALTDNDAFDGLSGNTVNILSGDRLEIQTASATVLGTFTVTNVNTLESHAEILLQERS